MTEHNTAALNLNLSNFLHFRCVHDRIINLYIKNEYIKNE